MTDNKKYIINVGDQSEVWDTDMYNAKQDSLFAKYNDASVWEMEDVEGFDEDPTEKQYMVSVGNQSEIWDADMVKEKGAKLTEVYPDAHIQRISYKDYWGEQAEANRAKRKELAQPDEERNAKLAELGYYDDMSEGQRAYGLDAPSMIGLKPLSSVIELNSVSGQATYLDPRVQEFFAEDSAYTDKMSQIAQLDAEYDVNPSVIAQREWEAKMLEERKAYAGKLEEQIKADMESDVDVIKAARGGSAKHQYGSDLASDQMSYLLDIVAGDKAGSGASENEKSENYNSALKFLEKAKIARDIAGKGFGGAVVDWAKEGVMDLATQDDIETYNEIGNILTRLEKEVGNLKAENLTEEVFDKYLSKDEQALIKAFYEYNSAMGEAQQDMSRAYKGGKIFAESVPFMLEFLITGGVYKGAGRAATSWMGKSFAKWIAKSAKGTAVRTAKKLATKAISGAVKAAVGTAARTLISPGTYDRMAEASVNIDKDGHLNKAKESAIAFADMYIENLSEISGDLIGDTLGLFAKGIGKGAGWVISKTPLSKVGGLLANNAFMQKVSALGKGVKDFMPKLKALGFHGLPEEVGEEFIGNTIRDIANIQPGALKEMVSDDNFGAMLIGFTPMTLLGVAGGAYTLGVVNAKAAQLGKDLREKLGSAYTEEELDHMMGVIQNAQTAEEIQKALKPMAMAAVNSFEKGVISKEQMTEQVEMLYQYGGFMAQNNALVFGKKAQDRQMMDAKREEFTNQYGRFWQEDQNETVQIATLNNGSTVFVVSTPAEDGKITTIDVNTGKKGFANVSDIATQEVEGELIQSTNSMTMDAFLNGHIATQRKTAEETRMNNERNAQIEALASQITPGTRINLGTEGSPIYVFAKRTNKNGVVVVDETGMESLLGWEQAAYALGQPIKVETDQEKLDAEISERLQRMAERRMQRAVTPAAQATTEAAEGAAEVVAQEQQNIPLNEDGSVNEALFWTKDPEGYVKWNDEQNQDGGQDSLRQIAISKQELIGMLNEAATGQNTSNPTMRKAAEKQVAAIAEKIARLEALEMSYADALAEEQESIKQTAATPTASMSEEDLESMDAQYQGILGKTRVQSERVRVMQEYLDKLAENSAPIKVLTKDNYEEVMRAEGCPEDDIKRVGKALNRKRGGQVAGFASNGVTFVMANTIADINSARITYIHERQHLLNSQNPEVVKQFAAALGDKENALRILETFVGKNGLEEYKNDSIEKLADEIICRSMEIVYSTENYSVDLQNQGLSEEAINIINTIDNGQRTDKSLSSARRSSYVNGSRRENIEENGRNSEQVSGGILGEQEAGSLGSGGRGDGLRGQGSTEEEVAAQNEELPFRIVGKPEDPNGVTAEQNDEINRSVGGELEIGEENAPVRFSVTAIGEGAGITILKDDGEGNVAFELPDGRRFNANNLLKPEDIKSLPDTVLGYMMKDAKSLGVVDPAKEWMLWNKYTLMLNAILLKGSAENGGYETLSSQWQWIGDTIYKTVAINSDSQYSFSLDITRVCKKNEAVINAIAEMQARLGYGITPGQIMDIYLTTSEEGYQVPCPVCYVFSRYIRNGKYATIMINGQRKYGSKLVDPSTLTPAQKKKRIEYWLNELQKIKDENKANSKEIAKANSDITTLLDEVDKIAKEITNPENNFTEEQKTQMMNKIYELDARYKAALNVVSQASLDSWITQFAIHKMKIDGKEQWVLFEDSYMGFPEEMALDLRQTSAVMRKYPAIQRFRNSRGAAAGKEITFVANNDLGDVPLALGSASATKDLAKPREMSDEEWEAIKADEYAKLKLGVKNLYQQAAQEKNPAKKKKLLEAAKRRFTAASIYAKQQSLRGGQRMWSWSDNIERLAPDVFVNLLQLEMLGGALQSYSKQLEGIKLVASMNGYVNGSLMGKGNGYREVTPEEIEEVEGQLYLKDGDFVVAEPGKKPFILKTPVYQHTDGKYYVLEFDDVVGIDPFGKDIDGKHMKGLFELNAEYDRAGNIVVGMNDLHIRMCMADDRIFFIIPWHSSGANSHILAQMYEYLGVEYDVKLSQDYTDVQSEKRFKAPKEAEEETETNEEEETTEEEEGGKKKESNVISQFLVDFWNDHYENAREYAGYGAVAGKDFPCGIEGGVESSDGKGNLSASQLHYRELRDAIFVGVKVPNGVDKNGKPKTKTITVEEYSEEWFNEIMNDAFLSQVYTKVRALMGNKGMTSADTKAIYPYEYWDENSTYDTADINGARYLEYCRRLGYKPKFCGKLDGKPESDHGNFTDDKGYWKVLIDRRMYAISGRFQDLTPVTAENFTPDLVDPEVTKEEFVVTRVADEAGTQTIVDKAIAREESRPGGIAKVDYDMTLSEALDVYNGGDVRMRTSAPSGAIDLVEEARKAQAKHDAKEKKGKRSDVSFRITPEQDKAYMDAVEAGDMETAQRMVDEAAAKAGFTIRGDHGRVSKFTIFDRDKANPESDWGQGFYFSNNEEDVENNYATVDGPDLEAKIEREVERRINFAEMNEEFNEDGEVDEFAIRDAVEEEFITSEPNVVHAAIKMNNPFVVGHGMVEIGEDGLGHYDMQETYLTAEYETDEEGEVDYSADPTGTLVDLVEALNDELSEYEGVNINAYEILSNNFEGMTAGQFEKEARELLAPYIDSLVNDNLEIMSSEIIRAAIERAGFDGIVDNTVNQKFGSARKYGQAMEGMDRDTRHYIAFQSSQIKQTDAVTYDDQGYVIPLSERFNPENADIRFRTSNDNQAIFVSNAARAVEGIKQEKATPEQWLKMIEKNGGLKAGEDKWMGLSDWLKASDKKTLTKQEVLDFINENMIIIEEQHYEEDVLDEEALWYKYEESEEGMDAINYQMQLDAEAYAERELADSDLEGEEWEQEYERLVSDYIEDDLFGSARSAAKDAVRDLWMEEEAPKLMKGASREINSTRINYTTEGLDNLHEIALTVPTIESWNESDDIHFGDAGDGRAVAWIRFGETALTEVVKKDYQPKNEIEQQIKDYIEWCMKDGESLDDCIGYAYNQMDADPEGTVGWTDEAVASVAKGMRGENTTRVLVIDEIQSKRHQEGREKGYKPKDYWPLRTKYLTTKTVYDSFYGDMEGKYGEAFSEASTEEDFRKVMSESDFSQMLRIKEDFERASNAYIPYRNSVPDAPFDKNWHELAMKRMLRYAAENGYDVIAWTKGDQQAERYNIGSYVSSIEAQEEYDGNRDFGFYMGDSDEALTVTVDQNGIVVSAEDHLSQAVGRPLADLVGKEMAVKMMQMEEYDVLEDTDLKVGNEGMKGFYDKMLPAFMNKYGKKWGVKVEDIELNGLKNGLTMHSVPVTEEMKASVMEGQVMFRVRGENESAIDFCVSVVREVKSNYRIDAKTRVAEVNEENAKVLGYKDGVIDDSAIYLPDYNMIVIFAHEELDNSLDIENAVFHEINHKYYDNPSIGDWLWKYSDGVAYLADLKREIIETYSKKGFSEAEQKEELYCETMAQAMSLGTMKVFYEKLPQEYKATVDKVLNETRYDKEREFTERIRRSAESNSGADSGSSELSRQKQESNGLQPGDEKQTGEDAARNNRVGPGAGTRLRVTEITPEVQDELDAIKASAIVMGNFMKAPNGKDTNLTEEQWLMVRTKNFLRWFGDWINDPENASKVVDENGEPKVVFHGGAWRPLLEEKGNAVFKMRGGLMGKGAYFTDTLSTAIDYAREKYGWEHDEEVSDEFLDDNGYVTEVFLNIRNEDNIREYYGETYYLATNFGQIKSAVANTGEFSQNFDIRFRVADSESKREIINNTEPVDVIKGAIAATDGESVSKAALRWFEENVGKELTYNTEVGTVTINRRSVKNSLAHGYSQTKLDAITSLPEGFGRAVYLASEDDFDGKPEVNHYFVYPINYDGSIHYVLCRVKSDVNKSSLYIHEVFPIDAIKGHTLQTAADQSQPHRGISLYLDLLKEVLYGKDTDNLETTNDSEENISLRVNENPTEAQKEAGNYKMGHLNLDGYRITIENPKGSIRRGTDSKGNAWENTLNNDYGYIRGTEGVDGDHIDVYLSDNPSEGNVFVVDQVNPQTREFDEHKVMYGFNSTEEAREAYLANFSEGWDGLGTITEVTKDEFKKWIQSSHRKTKPFSEYKSVKAIGAQSEGEEMEDYLLPSSGTPTDEVVANGLDLTPAQTAELAGNIFAALPEDVRRKITDGLNGNILGLQDAILQIPTSLATKENWNDEDRAMAAVVRDVIQELVDANPTTRPLTTKEALWMLYDSTNTVKDLVDAASRAFVAHNLGFDPASMQRKQEVNDYLRFRTASNGAIDAATDMYNFETSLWTERLKESWLDMNQSVISLQKAMAEASGMPIEPWENIEFALNRLSSKSFADKKKYMRDFLVPMWDTILDIVKHDHVSIEEIERYMMLKHGLERNKKFASRDAKEFYRAMYDLVAERMKSQSHAQQVVALSEANKALADIRAKMANATGQKLASLQEAEKKAMMDVQIADLVLRGDEQQNETELQAYYDAIDNEADPKYREFREKDYGGLTSMFVDTTDVKRSDYKSEEAYQQAVLAATTPRYNDVAAMESAAEREVSLFENKVYMYKALWDKVNAATKETLRHQYESGMITLEQYEAVRDMFEFYVPLRGFADNTAEDMYSYYMNNSAGGFTKPILGAKGRKTRAESPLGWIGTMAESAIQSDNKNQAKMCLYYMTLRRPDQNLVTITETWYEYTGQKDANGKKIFKAAYPPAVGQALSADDLRQHMDTWEADMKQKQSRGEAYKGSQRVDLHGSVIFQDEKEEKEHIVRVKVAGKDYSILINGNPRAAQAINGLLNPDANVGPVAQWVGDARRNLSALLTSYSPLFWVANYQRDLLSSTMRVSEADGWDAAMKYLANRRKAWRVVSYIYKYDAGTLGDSYYEKLYKEFAENGGITGYTSLTTNKEYENLLEKYANNVDKHVLNAVKGVWDKFMGFGEAIEQVSRFAAFITAREDGKSIEEAINAAKEVSVNFNRKGSAKPISLDELDRLRTKDGKKLNNAQRIAALTLSAMPGPMKFCYYFVNASIQALSSSAKLAKKSPGKATTWVGMYMGTSIALAMLNYLLSDDDDEEYLNLPDYLRHSTALVKVADGYYFKWSIPQEMRPFYAWADILVRKMMGKMLHKSGKDVGKEMALAASQWLPVNPFEAEDPLLSIVPDFASPLAELKANQNSFGGKIYDDMAFKSEGVVKEIPAYRKATEKTGAIYVDMAEFLNDISGGNEVEKGWININPAMVEHIVEGYGGGIYDFAKMMVSIPSIMISDDPVQIKEIPFVNKVILSVDETNMYSHTNEAFYHYRDIADNAKRVEKEYRESDDPSRADAYREEEDWRIYLLYKEYEKDFKDVKERLDNAVDKDEEYLLKQEQNALREMFLDNIAKGDIPEVTFQIREDIKRIDKEIKAVKKPVTDANKERLEKRSIGDVDGMLKAIEKRDSLKETPEYQRAEELSVDLNTIKQQLKELDSIERGPQRDSIIGELQRNYDNLIRKMK